MFTEHRSSKTSLCQSPRMLPLRQLRTATSPSCLTWAHRVSFRSRKAAAVATLERTLTPLIQVRILVPQPASPVSQPQSRLS